MTIETNAPIPTWFHVGGGADRLARPGDAAQLGECVRIDPRLRVLGDGANLLVDDAGVGELVVSLAQGEFTKVQVDERTGWVRAGAGANLPKLVNCCVRQGLGGLEGLGGIPASVGGAAVMNAGGAFGEIAAAVERVHAVRRDGSAVTLERGRIDFGYRRSGLGDVIVTAVEFRLTPGDPAALRARLLEVMEYKKQSQPMAENSAGCAFKNPTLTADVAVPEPLGAGSRVSAGMLIDRAGCKGLRIGSASVSERHGNFLTADRGGRAADVIALIEEVRRRVFDRFGVRLENEVVVWARGARG